MQNQYILSMSVLNRLVMVRIRIFLIMQQLSAFTSLSAALSRQLFIGNKKVFSSTYWLAIHYKLRMWHSSSEKIPYRTDNSTECNIIIRHSLHHTNVIII